MPWSPSDNEQRRARGSESRGRGVRPLHRGGRHLPASPGGLVRRGEDPAAGACGARTTAATHGRLADYPALSFLDAENSPIRLEIERVARQAGLRFIVNTVLDAEARIAGVFAGDPVAAHRAGVAFARGVWTAVIPDLADIVVASSYPADIDFWQAQKTLHFMECAVKRGGDLILLTPCPEGISGGSTTGT